MENTNEKFPSSGCTWSWTVLSVRHICRTISPRWITSPSRYRTSGSRNCARRWSTCTLAVSRTATSRRITSGEHLIGRLRIQTSSKSRVLLPPTARECRVPSGRQRFTVRYLDVHVAGTVVLRSTRSWPTCGLPVCRYFVWSSGGFCPRTRNPLPTTQRI